MAGEGWWLPDSPLQGPLAVEGLLCPFPPRFGVLKPLYIIFISMCREREGQCWRDVIDQKPVVFFMSFSLCFILGSILLVPCVVWLQGFRPPRLSLARQFLWQVLGRIKVLE